MRGAPGHAPHRVELDFGTAMVSGGNGLDGVTSFTAPFEVAGLDQDGCSAMLGALCPARPPRRP